MTETFEIGDRWVETTPSGRQHVYEVIDLDVPPKHQHRPGNCIQMRPVNGGCCDIIMWPDDILAVEWLRRADD